MQHTLQRIVEAAAGNPDGEVWASVSLVKQRREVGTRRAAMTGRRGPTNCSTSWRRGRVWARAVAKETGIRSSLSLQLFIDENQESLGALNLYSPQLNAFDTETRGEGLAFAAQAAVALRSAQTEQNLRSAMATRTLTGQAQGILMERLKITPDQAFGELSRLSQERNVKLRGAARRLVETGEIAGRPQR